MTRALALGLWLCAAPALADGPSLLDKNDSGDRVGRVAAELAAALLGAALPTLLWAPFFAFNSSEWPVMFGIAMALTPLAVATGGWLAHRAMGGKGLWASSLLGVLLGLAVGGTLVGVAWAEIPWSKPVYLAAANAAGVLFTLVLTGTALELSHDRNSELDVEAGLSPMPGGGAGFVRVRF